MYVKGRHIVVPSILEPASPPLPSFSTPTCDLNPNIPITNNPRSWKSSALYHTTTDIGGVTMQDDEEDIGELYQDQGNMAALVVHKDTTDGALLVVYCNDESVNRVVRMSCKDQRTQTPET
uniref:Uncharacterized protein n=1 Tax=Timema bartmani TaxID=61472 RepID=A0A7R9EQ41_9NEOP|nr:unnamed protein product [Timema bartmani]